MSDGEEVEAGISIAHDLTRKLGILPDQLIKGVYGDLLDKNIQSPRLANKGRQRVQSGKKEI
ncbi:MAG: hypothetical protein AB1585_10580 [Thermodesulfobacteriota bacterium]